MAGKRLSSLNSRDWHVLLLKDADEEQVGSLTTPWDVDTAVRLAYSVLEQGRADFVDIHVFSAGVLASHPVRTLSLDDEE